MTLDDIIDDLLSCRLTRLQQLENQSRGMQSPDRQVRPDDPLERDGTLDLRDHVDVERFDTDQVHADALLCLADWIAVRPDVAARSGPAPRGLFSLHSEHLTFGDGARPRGHDPT